MFGQNQSPKYKVQGFISSNAVPSSGLFFAKPKVPSTGNFSVKLKVPSTGDFLVKIKVPSTENFIFKVKVPSTENFFFKLKVPWPVQRIFLQTQTLPVQYRRILFVYQNSPTNEISFDKMNKYSFASLTIARLVHEKSPSSEGEKRCYRNRSISFSSEISGQMW